MPKNSVTGALIRTFIVNQREETALVDVPLYEQKALIILNMMKWLF